MPAVTGTAIPSHWIRFIEVGNKARNKPDSLLTYVMYVDDYRKTSSISRTKSQNLNVSCIFLQLSSPNPLKPSVKLRMEM